MAQYKFKTGQKVKYVPSDGYKPRFASYKVKSCFQRGGANMYTIANSFGIEAGGDISESELRAVSASAAKKKVAPRKKATVKKKSAAKKKSGQLSLGFKKKAATKRRKKAPTVTALARRVSELEKSLGKEKKKEKRLSGKLQGIRKKSKVKPRKRKPAIKK